MATRLTDRVLREANERNREAEKKRSRIFYPELDGTETGMAYMDPPGFININSDKSVFDTDDDTSINTAKSVFDRTAVFHTGTTNN